MDWTYTTTEYTVTEYESYNGYSHKYDTPRHYITHRIVRLGKNENTLETIVEMTAQVNTKLSKQIAKNFTTIVNAVNGKLAESG